METTFEEDATPIVDSGLVGYVVGERPGGSAAVFGCLDHAPSHTRVSNRMVFRSEAIADEAKCGICGEVLARAAAGAVA